jgi:dihydrofolate synthase/folylpolyglutamate synthase
MRDGHARLDLATPTRPYPPMTLALRGRHQVANALAAVRLLEELDNRGMLRVPATAIRMGLEDVTWPGRLELLTIDGRSVLVDGAHNAAGAAALALFLVEEYGRPLPLVLGVLRDKDVSAIVAPLLPQTSCVVCTAAQSPRAMAPHDLAAVVASIDPAIHVEICADVHGAIAAAASAGTPVVVAGSLYLAGEVRARYS